MNPQQIVALGVRFFAVFAVLHSVDYLIRIPAGMKNTNLEMQACVSYGFGAICLLIALLLWFFPLAMANRILPRTGLQNRLNLQAFYAARVGGSLIGLWLFANAMPGVLWFLFLGAASSTTSQSIVGALVTEDKVKLAYYAAQLLLAFVLIFKSHLFAPIAMRNNQDSHADA
jgi:hypothetical protein